MRASQLIGAYLMDQWTMRWAAGGAGATCAAVAPQLTARVAPNHYVYYDGGASVGGGGKAATKPFDV